MFIINKLNYIAVNFAANNEVQTKHIILVPLKKGFNLFVYKIDNQQLQQQCCFFNSIEFNRLLSAVDAIKLGTMEYLSFWKTVRFGSLIITKC